MNEISRTNIQNSSDSPEVYLQAFRAAQTAGLPPTDQIRYASLIVDLFFVSNSPQGSLLFRIGYNKNGEPVLQAVMEDQDLAFETIIPAIPLSFQNTAAANTSLQHSDDMERFTFAASHELKNSLTKLKLAISLLETDEDPQSIQQHIKIIQRSSTQLEHIINDLNAIIRLRHDTPMVRPLSIEKVFSRAYEDHKEKIAAADASVSTDFGGISDWIYVEVYLQSIFSHLLSNSLKYASANRRPDISIKATKNNEDLLITFSDNGQGIDLDLHKKDLFTPFAQFSSTQRKGKGLGLYIIKSIIERNGGTINVHSAPDQGTTFNILLRQYPII